MWCHYFYCSLVWSCTLSVDDPFYFIVEYSGHSQPRDLVRENFVEKGDGKAT